ncbi:hypothetical protein [Rhodanobacter ginsengiterrae]|uniref:hypothetical protein n=1 Tax=Rhodanobacter ginsengiterrae TaxID=2008451 RepID=UPI003CEE7EC7
MAERSRISQGRAVQYDQSWMGYGIMGGVQAGLLSAVAGFVLFLLFHWLGKRNGWSYGPQIGWSFLLATALTASGDLWNLFYFNYGRMQSLQLLKVKLAEVHDPGSIGLRALCELLGVALGIYVAWALCSGDWKRRLRRGP